MVNSVSMHIALIYTHTGCSPVLSSKSLRRLTNSSSSLINHTGIIVSTVVVFFLFL